CATRAMSRRVARTERSERNDNDPDLRQRGLAHCERLLAPEPARLLSRTWKAFTRPSRTWGTPPRN
ncbi:hypothetical protein LB579_29825, partial [Mesorhizobium sp. BR1-1-7]|uniref:hypothetical protein n=1 Tax=Mesorhizobium sp. BR1-1-7 TaxID=2876647 RepID=UPI001CCC2457